MYLPLFFGKESISKNYKILSYHNTRYLFFRGQHKILVLLFFSNWNYLDNTPSIMYTDILNILEYVSFMRLSFQIFLCLVRCTWVDNQPKFHCAPTNHCMIIIASFHHLFPYFSCNIKEEKSTNKKLL